ncbi:MAG: ABC transporter permease [Saprospiraceae bacterium]
MKTFLAFIRKEFWHILRDRRSLIILFGMPVMQIVLFGFALSNELKNSRIAILDASHDAYTQRIVQQLNSSEYFTVTTSIQDEKEIEPLFLKNKVKMVVVFPRGFADLLSHQHEAKVQLIADATDTNTANTMVGYASSILSSFQDWLLDQESLPYTIHTETHMLYNPQLRSAYNFVPGLMAMIIMVLSAMMTSVAIVRERENGNMEVLLVSPLKPMWIVVAKAVPYFLLSFINVLIILILSYTLLSLPVHGSLILFLTSCLVFILTSLALGLLISTVAGSQQVAMFMSLIGLLMPTILLSGFMFPIENMPWILRAISHIVPARWFYTITQSILLKGVSLFTLWKELLILVGMALFFLVISIRRFRLRLN